VFKKSLFFSFILLFSFLTLCAQNVVTINGTVKDSIANPVVAASVTIVNQEGSGITFAKTDQQGSFNCRFPGTTEELFIKVTCLGYQQYRVPLTQTGNETYSIILKKAVNQLKEVTIRSDNKISLSSDTLKYSVKAFKDQNDRVIADLINRLPGIQVDDKGAISYNGKRITNVYIDGDNLLSAKYKLVTNNVPVGAVEEVQVIERDQPIKALNGYVIANNVSLNLKLTDSARTMTFNTGYVGLGNKAYSAELSTIVFQKKVKSINTLKTNNIGENLENENADIGVSANEINLKKPEPYLSMETQTPPSLADKYYLMNNDHAANTNTLFKFKSDWSLRLNISALQLKRKYNYNNAVSYFLTHTDTIRYDEVRNDVFKLNQWQIQTQIEQNGNSVYIKSTTRLDLPKWSRNGNTRQNGLDFKQTQPTNYLSVSNETNVIKALRVNNIFQYNSTVQYYIVDESLGILPGIQKEIVNNDTSYLMLDQQAHTKNIFINQSATYKSKFNQFIFSASVGASFERTKLNTNLYKTDSVNRISDAGSPFKNDLKFDNLRVFGKTSLIYLIQKGSIRIEANPTYNFINYASPEKTFSQKNSYFIANPTAEFQKKTGRYGEFNFTYTQQTEFGQVNDIYPGTILVNYRQFNFNDAPLPKTDINSFVARYAYRKPLKMFFYNFNFNYDRSKQNFINAYTIDSGVTRSTAIDFINKSDRYSLSGNISKYLFFLSTNLSLYGGLGLQKGNSFYNNEITPFNSYTINLAATARKNLFDKATLSLTAEIAKFINQQNTLHNNLIKNTTNSAKIKAQWQQNLSDQVSYVITYHLNSYHQSSRQALNNSFMDLNAKYAPSKWKSFFEFQCSNLVNQNLYKQINSSSNQLSVFQIPLRERTFLIKYFFTF
jgi:hypothetical protein